MRARLAAILCGMLALVVLLPSESQSQTYRGNLQCTSGFTGVRITAVDFWCSDGPCLNVARCNNLFICPGLVASFGGGNLSCSSVLDNDKVRDFTLTPCNPLNCYHQNPAVTANCRRWAEVSYVCSVSPMTTNTVCMRVPGSVTLSCPPSDIATAAGGDEAAIFTFKEILPEYVATSDCLPPPTGSYEGTFHALYAAGLVNLNDPIHAGFTNCNPPPPAVPGSTTVESFGSTVTATITMGDSSMLMTAPASCTVSVTFSSTDGETQFYETEMLALDISGGSLPAGVLIRESPTLGSLGGTTIRPAAGMFITSSFDVFTELSLDGGMTWYPSTDPAGASYAGKMVLQGNLSNVSDAGGTAPAVTALLQSSPNPFNPITTIEFELARSGSVQLEIFDVGGRPVRFLVDQSLVAGRHRRIWNGLDDAGKRVSSGVYVYRLVTTDFVATKKMVLMK